MLLSASEIVKNSYFLCTKNWRRLFTYVLFIFLPTLVLALLGIVGIYLTAYLPVLTLTTNLIIIAVFTASLIFTLWTTLALAKEIQLILQNQTSPGWKNNFATTSHLMWPLIYTSALVTILVLLGSFLLIIPGIIFIVWYYFIFYTLVFDGQRGFSALKQSKNLVVGRWFPMAWRMLLPALLFSMIAMIVQYVIVSIFTFFLESTIIIGIINTIISSIVNSLIAPLIMSAGIILFFNAKTNKLETPATTAPPKN